MTRDAWGRILLRHSFEDLSLLLAIRVGEPELEHETVHLGLGERVGPLLLDRVLCGQDDERLFERIGRVADRHLALLHRLQKCTLDLGRGAVDLIGEDEVGKDRPLLGNEDPLLLVVDEGSQKVRGQEIGGELDTVEFGADGVRQAANRKGLGEPRHTFQ